MATDQQPTANSKALESAGLGLDIGTSASRACVAPSRLRGKTGEEPWIVYRPDQPQHRERFEAGDFASAANFFDVDKPPLDCIGYIGDDPDQTPVKMNMYIARIVKLRQRGNPEDLQNVAVYRDRMPQLDRFFYRFDRLDNHMQRRVLSHAQSIFLAHLGQIRSESEITAELKKVKITRLAATIPPNWDVWTQRFYVLLLAKVWDNLDVEDIHLLHESEAIGHWLLCLDPKTQALRPRQLIVADFGGHTLNMNVFEINYQSDDSDQFSFFTVSVDNCVHGGSELHAASVKERIRKDLDNRKIEVPQRDVAFLYESLMNDYRSEKRRTIDGKMFRIEGRSNPDRRQPANTVEVVFKDEQALKLYENCFGKPLARLYDMLRLFKTPEPINGVTAVVLNGGTFSNDYILNQTKREINHPNLKHIHWSGNVSVDGRRSSTVAAGASLALVNTLSVKEFMSRAAFAVLVKPAKKDTIPVIWNGSGTQTASIHLKGAQGADVFIACCPLAPQNNAKSVPIDSTFELQSLSKNLRGKYKISLDYVEKSDEGNTPDRLILTVTEMMRDRAASVATVEWLVYYDLGSCACLVDVDKHNEMRGDGQIVLDFGLTRFSNRKGTRSYELWEKNRLDPSKAYWEGPDVPSLPFPTLEEFQMDEPIRNDEAPVIEILDSDEIDSQSLSRPARSRGNRGRARGSRQRPSRSCQTAPRGSRNTAARPTNASQREKRKKSPALELDNSVRQRSSRRTRNPDLDSEALDSEALDSEAMDYEFVTSDLQMEACDFSRSQTVSQHTQGSQVSAQVSDPLQHDAHGLLLSFDASHEAMQSTENSSRTHPTGNTVRSQTTLSAVPTHPSSSVPPSASGFRSGSNRNMSSGSQVDSSNQDVDFTVDDSPREELSSNTGADNGAVMSAVGSPEHSTQGSIHAQVRTNAEPVKLPELMHERSDEPWGDGVMRDWGVSNASKPRNA